jgi:hypothetical protein
MQSFVASVILYHETSFCIAERTQRSVARAGAARQRVIGWLTGPTSGNAAALVLTGPAAVAWISGGVAPPVDRTASTDLVWAVISPGGAALVTTNVEADRIRAEYDPAGHGFSELAEVPWHQPERFTEVACEIAGAPAAAAKAEPAYAALRRKVLSIEHAVLGASMPGVTYGTALDALAGAYAAAGSAGAWSGHYQGGPIGFGQREFEVAPGQTGSRWYRQPIAAGHAVAWNPSLPGGAKAEDTYLVTAESGLVRLTAADGWPTEGNDERQPPRPAVLEVGT